MRGIFKFSPWTLIIANVILITDYAPGVSQPLSIRSFNLQNKPMGYHFTDGETGHINYFAKDFTVSKINDLYQSELETFSQIL